jgi:hypothetical protein
MRVTVDIPDSVWWRASQRAENEGIRVADVIHTAVLNMAGQESVRQIQTRARRNAVVALALEGHPDKAICEYTGEDREYVARVRRTAGIKANRGAGKKEKTA